MLIHNQLSRFEGEKHGRAPRFIFKIFTKSLKYFIWLKSIMITHYQYHIFLSVKKKREFFQNLIWEILADESWCFFFLWMDTYESWCFFFLMKNIKLMILFSVSELSNVVHAWWASVISPQYRWTMTGN